MPDPIGVVTVAARLRQLDAQATPGPWQWLRVGKDGAHICAASGGAAVVEEMESEGPGWERTDANAAVIVRSRNLLPLLADLAEAAEEAHDARCPCRKDATVPPCPMGAALARVADQLDQEEGSA